MPKTCTFTEKTYSVTARFSRRDNPEGTAPEWGELKPVSLLVTQRDQAYKGRPAGYIVMVSVVGFDWAEYSGADWSREFQTFTVEEYRMQIASGWTPDGIKGVFANA